MLASQARRFAEALVDRHVITRQTLEQVIAEVTSSGRTVEEVIRGLADLGPRDLACGYAAAAGMEFVDLEATVVHADAVAAVPSDLARRLCAVGVEISGNRLTAAFPMPPVGEDIRELSQAMRAEGLEVYPVGAERGDIQAALGAGGIGSPTLAKSAGPKPASAEERLIELIEQTVDLGASDLHLAADQPPFVRILGELVRMPKARVLSSAEVRDLGVSIISARQREQFEQTGEIDCSYSVPGRARLRVNLFIERGAVGVALRVIPFDVVPFELTGIPSVVGSFAQLNRGLVLVTGPTGSGKSTTLASVIDIANENRQIHILTIEDPIEFIHQSKRALVTQREVGSDTGGFSVALTQALRQDPDMILVGEMRDLETVRTALTAAETGHLVLATLHTQDTASAIDRIIDVFPPDQQGQVRSQLASSLQGVVSQQLVPTVDGASRVPACEVLLATPAVRSLIREGKVHQLPNAIASGRNLGMQSADMSLAELVKMGAITSEEAYRRARDANSFAAYLGASTPYYG